MKIKFDQIALYTVVAFGAAALGFGARHWVIIKGVETINPNFAFAIAFILSLLLYLTIRFVMENFFELLFMLLKPRSKDNKKA